MRCRVTKTQFNTTPKENTSVRLLSFYFYWNCWVYYVSSHNTKKKLIETCRIFCRNNNKDNEALIFDTLKSGIRFNRLLGDAWTKVCVYYVCISHQKCLILHCNGVIPPQIVDIICYSYFFRFWKRLVVLSNKRYSWYNSNVILAKHSIV